MISFDYSQSSGSRQEPLDHEGYSKEEPEATHPPKEEY